MQNAALRIEESPRHGFDGEAPELVAPRDVDGEGKRELAERENVKSDRIFWLWRHHYIDGAEYSAGEKLQKDWQLAQLGGYSAMGQGTSRVVNLVPSNLPDAKCDAMGRVNRVRTAMTAVHPIAWKLVELVVLQNIQPAEAGKRLWGRSRKGEPIRAIQGAMNELAKVYGLV